MTLPLRGISRITFPYGVRYKSGVLHKGVDYSDGAEGHVVQAVLPGVVSHAGYGGWGPAYGNHVIVRSILKGPWYKAFKRTQVWSLYGHMKAVNAGTGDTVKVGDQLGLSGGAAGKKYSGNSTGAHLHFQVGTANDYLHYINPMPFIAFKTTVSPADFTTDKMKATSYGEGAISPAVEWLGQRLVLHLAALGIKSPYKVGPGKIWGPADKAAVKLIQKHLGFTGKDADGYPGLKTLKFLAADPKTPAPPKPTPPKSELVAFDLGFHNVSGYNPTGIKTFYDRITRKGGLASVIANGTYDAYGYAELSGVDDNKGRDMVRTLTDKVKPKMLHAPGGGKGTWVFHNAKTKLLASGQVELKPLWKGNDKQAAWEVIEKAGVRLLFASGHLTPQDPTEKTPLAQLANGISQLTAIAKKHGVPADNIVWMLDGNIEQDVSPVVEGLGWRLANKSAPTVINGEWKTFTGWRPQSKGIQIDICVCPKGLELGEFANVRDNSLADHNRIRVRVFARV